MRSCDPAAAVVVTDQQHAILPLGYYRDMVSPARRQSAPAQILLEHQQPRSAHGVRTSHHIEAFGLSMVPPGFAHHTLRRSVIAYSFVASIALDERVDRFGGPTMRFRAAPHVAQEALAGLMCLSCGLESECLTMTFELAGIAISHGQRACLLALISSDRL